MQFISYIFNVRCWNSTKSCATEQWAKEMKKEKDKNLECRNSLPSKISDFGSEVNNICLKYLRKFYLKNVWIPFSLSLSCFLFLPLSVCTRQSLIIVVSVYLLCDSHVRGLTCEILSVSHSQPLSIHLIYHLTLAYCEMLPPAAWYLIWI